MQQDSTTALAFGSSGSSDPPPFLGGSAFPDIPKKGDPKSYDQKIGKAQIGGIDYKRGPVISHSIICFCCKHNVYKHTKA